ncbi:hypothetical protein HPB47_027067 [Ixodes persulcatus]|uniref:Uncharacterized protein n=1 Tax=Ixodes persulcatus TaxID=34615 RepID=A0AC60PY45_IXOPE|nr:hypothetical protein HPB47_027067 [Ixodes persulcatus]
MGSDHFPIKITLAAEKPVTRETKFIQWDCFKMAFEREDQEQSIKSSPQSFNQNLQCQGRGP